MPTAPAAPQDLTARDPREGDRLQFRKVFWQVTEQSTYNNEEGYRCVEWTCEYGDEEGYLLKETEADHSRKWFFTLTIDDGAVKLATGDKLEAWLQKNGKSQPIPQLVYNGQTYRYADKTEGTYTDDSGDRSQKTTWDYWDAAHARNLAVELWESGEFDCYLGNYIKASDVVFSPRPNVFAGHDFFNSNGIKAAAWAAFLAFYVLGSIGGAFDQVLTFILGALLLAGWLYPVLDAPRLASASVATAVALGCLFWYFPPLTSPLGFVLFLGAPALLAWFAKHADHSLSDKAARIHVAYALEFPLVVLGFVHYFRFAPAPHDFGQYCLALAPAVLGGFVAWGVTAYIFSDWGPDGPRLPAAGDASS